MGWEARGDMSQGRTYRGGATGTPVEDAEQIRHLLTVLQADATEFPVKVEGTHTLPYTARLEHLEPGAMDLKLIRPLPHELAGGAPFEMLFATDDQRYRGLMEFRGRQGYLLYRFTVPAQLVPCDQRRHKRYPFRPREKAYVLAQDGALPGHGLSGPLVNLSLGGLAFRVDRLLRLDDHMPLKPVLTFFEKGKVLPMIKIRDLPKLPLFEVRGKVANASERGSEIIVGIQFGELAPAELAQLQEVLEVRECMMHAPASVLPAGTREPHRAPDAPGSPRVQPAGRENPEALLMLERRATSILMAMPPGPARDHACEALTRAGYLRLEAVDSLPQALALLRADRSASSRLIMALAERLQPEELADLQALQRDFGELQELAVALMTTSIPLAAPEPSGDLFLRHLPLPAPEAGGWLGILDEVAGLA